MTFSPRQINVLTLGPAYWTEDWMGARFGDLVLVQVERADWDEKEGVVWSMYHVRGERHGPESQPSEGVEVAELKEAVEPQYVWAELDYIASYEGYLAQSVPAAKLALLAAEGFITFPEYELLTTLKVFPSWLLGGKYPA